MMDLMAEDNDGNNVYDIYNSQHKDPTERQTGDAKIKVALLRYIECMQAECLSICEPDEPRHRLLYDCVEGEMIRVVSSEAVKRRFPSTAARKKEDYNRARAREAQRCKEQEKIIERKIAEERKRLNLAGQTNIVKQKPTITYQNR